MNYEEKYKNALERAKELCDVADSFTITIHDICTIFPELQEQESEDERIRKAIIAYISHDQHCGVSNADMIAWLEKQDEQKPTDKTKPKFKVGDWIVGNDGIFKITQYEDEYGYELTDTTGCVVHFVSPNYVESNFHLWTIADAKVGDMLANDKNILILKELGYDWSCNGTPNSVKAYCGIKPNGNFEIGKDNWSFCGTLHIHPATKEQRELLFQKIEEAGYEWDSTYKKLAIL